MTYKTKLVEASGGTIYTFAGDLDAAGKIIPRVQTVGSAGASRISAYDTSSHFTYYLSDFSGNIEVTGNYGSETHFYLSASPGVTMDIYRMIVFIEDSGNMDAGAYGNGITLTNGIRVVVSSITQGAVVNDLTDRLGVYSVKKNTHWSRLCHDLNHYTFGVGNQFISVRWTFERYGSPLPIDGDLGEALVVIVNDDFSGLLDHTFTVEGVQST